MSFNLFTTIMGMLPGIDELNARFDKIIGHKHDKTDFNGGAITAGSIDNIPAGNIISTNQQAVNAELDSRIGACTGTKNKIINGEPLVDQRNNGAAQTITSTAAYIVDRMYASASGANITGQQITGIGAYSKSYQFTGAASNTGVLFGQKIEAVNCRDLLNKMLTGQVELSSNSLTSITWKAYYANAADNFSAKTQIATGAITINSVPTIYNFSFNAGANARNGISIEFTTGALLATKTFAYSGLQLEPGSVASNFEYLDYGETLRRCQRYFISGGANLTGYQLAGNGIGYFVTFPVIMRAVPTISFSSTTYINGSLMTNSAANYNGFTAAATAPSTGSIQFNTLYIANAEL